MVVYSRKLECVSQPFSSCYSGFFGRLGSNFWQFIGKISLQKLLIRESKDSIKTQLAAKRFKKIERFGDIKITMQRSM